MSYEGPFGEQQPKNSLFHNVGGKSFVNVIDQIPVVNAGDHGVEWVDYNADGAIDLTLTDGYSPVGGHFVFRNDLPAPFAARSLSVLVLDAEGHFTRAGAEVRLYDASGKILASRQVLTGGGYNAQSAAPVHFGLASLAPVTVEVRFMAKDRSKTQTVKSIRPADYASKSLIICQKR